MSINFNVNQAQNFDNWTNSGVNTQSGKEEDFKMFDINLQTYSKDVKQFAQDYIDMYDTDGDKQLSYDEFVNMATGGAEIPDEYKSALDDLFHSAFDSLNADKDKEHISAGEYAAMLMTADIDQEYLSKSDGDLAGAIDGKLNFVNYSAYSSLTPEDGQQYENWMFQKNILYENFYGEA